MSRQGYVYALHFCQKTDQIIVLRFKTLKQREDMLIHVESVVACSPYHPVVANALACHNEDPKAWPWRTDEGMRSQDYNYLSGICAWGPLQS